MSDPFSNIPGPTAGEISAHDWARTSLGPIEGWPVSLRSTIATMLACPTPMFLAWGPELLCFYNDAYRPILGFRVGSALGAPFREVWDNIWADIAPLVAATLRGEPRTMTDMFLDLRREGVPEESWWSFSYSPAFDDAGEIAGLFCVTGETTQRVLAERARARADDRLELALSAGESIGVWDWDLTTDLVTADARFASLYGVDPDRAAAGAPIAEFFAGIHPDDLPRVSAEIERAIRDATPFFSEYRLAGADGSVRWVSAQGRCVYDDTGRCVRLPGVSFDVTRRVMAVEALTRAKEERDFVLDLVKRQRESLDADGILRMTSHALGERLGVSRVGFYRRVGATHLRHGANWVDGTLPPLTGLATLSAFGARAERLRMAGQSVIFGDSRVESDGDLLPFAESGVLAGICVPLMARGQWAAGIFLHQGEPRVWTQREIHLAKEVAEFTWIAVERAEALLRLSQRVDQQSVALAEASTEIAAEMTRRAEAEGQLRQLQKMDAVGQLTGGVAHDFNNMLAIIMSGINLARRRLDRGEQDVGRFLDGALEGANRAATLTQRLLAFARQQPLAPEAVDLNRLVSGLAELLTRSLGETIQLETVLGAGGWKARVDPNELENALINLAVNARDAMPEGGRLTIETCNAHIDDDYARSAEIAAGQYVQIAITDTGVGMAPDVLERAFDPFFTTKSAGKGTGLGLSQAYGFARQSGGHIRAYSEVGHGTTFRLYLPRFWGAETPAVRRAATAVTGAQPGETILVVEDEENLRRHSVDALRELGYEVLQAASGAEPLALIASGAPVTLLFTDIVMPGMTGRELADRALAISPRLRVLYTTGYTRNAIVHNGVLDPGTHFLPKPFGLDQLAAKVREALNTPA
ncbi:ATP-binding protein [Amaricoccus sp. W119]|uniref:ATP-binding protein n=1 Tax=Amaricoccus sp. W119 TaxID=3391833 RepID=UPI0039A632E7